MSEDTKPTLEEALETIAKLTTSVEKLQSKNTEIIGKLKSAQDEAEDARSERDEKAEEAERKSGDIAALEKRLTDKYEKQISKLQSDLEARDTDLRTIRVDNEISRVLDEQNVLSHMKGPLSAMYKAMAQYENGEATIEGAALSEHIATHLSGDDGAHYRAASQNSGGNANGNTSTKVTDKEFTKENFNLTKFSELAKSDPAKANAISEQLGLPYKV